MTTINATEDALYMRGIEASEVRDAENLRRARRHLDELLGGSFSTAPITLYSNGPEAALFDANVDGRRFRIRVPFDPSEAVEVHLVNWAGWVTVRSLADLPAAEQRLRYERFPAAVGILLLIITFGAFIAFGVASVLQ